MYVTSIALSISLTITLLLFQFAEIEYLTALLFTLMYCLIWIIYLNYLLIYYFKTLYKHFWKLIKKTTIRAHVEKDILLHTKYDMTLDYVRQN